MLRNFEGKPCADPKRVRIARELTGLSWEAAENWLGWPYYRLFKIEEGMLKIAPKEQSFLDLQDLTGATEDFLLGLEVELPPSAEYVLSCIVDPEDACRVRSLLEVIAGKGI